MPAVVFSQEQDRTVPFLLWFDELNPKIKAKCKVKIERLKLLGHNLRRPESDYLRDGIYELRVGFRGMNYRILYFFHCAATVVISHGITKEQIVPFREISKAIENERKFAQNPKLHTYEE